jgi:hypothetical protein
MAQSVARGSPTAGLPAWISPQLTQLVDVAIIDSKRRQLVQAQDEAFGELQAGRTY